MSQKPIAQPSILDGICRAAHDAGLVVWYEKRPGVVHPAPLVPKLIEEPDPEAAELARRGAA